MKGPLPGGGNRTGALLCAAVLTLVWVSAVAAQDEFALSRVPPLLDTGPGPGFLFQSLDPESTRRVEEGEVAVLDETVTHRQGERVYRVQSLGILDVPAPRVARVLGDFDAYPRWILLSPSYKEAEVRPGGRLEVGIGKHDREEPRTQALYALETAGDPGLLWSVRWRFERKVRAFEPGSFLHFAVAPHPDDPRRSLVLHTQETRVSGFLAKRYLSGTKDDGRSRHWHDAAKHARRIHGAFAVAAAGLQGERAREAYARHHKRQFGYRPVLMEEKARAASSEGR